jgi:hypothetical protein
VTDGGKADVGGIAPDLKWSTENLDHWLGDSQKFVPSRLLKNSAAFANEG